MGISRFFEGARADYARTNAHIYVLQRREPKMKTRTGWTAALAGLWPEPIRRALAAMGRDAQEGTD